MLDEKNKEIWGDKLEIVEGAVTSASMEEASKAVTRYYQGVELPALRKIGKIQHRRTAMLAAHWFEMQRKPDDFAALIQGIKIANQAKNPEMTAFVRALCKDEDNETSEAKKDQEISRIALRVLDLVDFMKGPERVPQKFGYVDTWNILGHLSLHKYDVIKNTAQGYRDLIAKRIERLALKASDAKAEEVKGEEDKDKLPASSPMITTLNEEDFHDDDDDAEGEVDLEAAADARAQLPPHPKLDPFVIAQIKTHAIVADQLSSEKNKRFVIAGEDGAIMLCEKDRAGRIIAVDWDWYDPDAFAQLVKDQFGFYNPLKFRD